MRGPSEKTQAALEAKVRKLPKSPGIYQFKSDGGAVLYVGKAQNLRSRVRQYLAGGDGRSQIPALMERTADVDILVTANVKEALLLENELIKRHKPVFNVKLRDDKQYLGLRMDPRDEWPRISSVRRFRRDGAEYFGPYTSSVALKESLSNLRRLFPLRSCSEGTFKDYARRGRPCIEYEMGRCLGPCCGLADPVAYAEQVRGTVLFLKGRSQELVTRLREQMISAAEAERFEDAARLRNRISAVDATLQDQQIISDQKVERDVFGLAREGGEVEIQVLHVREGRVIAAEDYSFSKVQIDDGEVMSSFLGQYYGKRNAEETPREIVNSVPFEDGGALQEWLRERASRAVSVRSPQRGGARRVVEIATRNAQVGLEQRLAARESIDAALEQIRSACALSQLPRRIECYDVSNLQGTLAVASRVVFEDGEPVKNEYRRYKIKQAPAGDDYACLREVLKRRLARVDTEPLPDLLMVDGGRGQLGVVSAALEDVGLVVDALGISKERDADSPSVRVKRSGGLKAERLFKPGRANPILLSKSSRGLLLLQRVRDESHRFAIEYQRDLRSKFSLTSILEELPGIGAVKRRALLRELGSLKAVREATEESLRAVSGISSRDAQILRAFFDKAGGRPISEGREEAPGDGDRDG
ncbi:MAG: excinuclease ABC subunit UvrC [Myxococcota bacterium]|nr:excinuclease ABC subunit UvrC [Myxococcota bacterium]